MRRFIIIVIEYFLMTSSRTANCFEDFSMSTLIDTLNATDFLIRFRSSTRSKTWVFHRLFSRHSSSKNHRHHHILSLNLRHSITRCLRIIKSSLHLITSTSNNFKISTIDSRVREDFSIATALTSHADIHSRWAWASTALDCSAFLDGDISEKSFFRSTETLANILLSKHWKRET